MTAGSWIKLPIWWINDIETLERRNPDLRSPGLKRFSHQDTGASIGALKAYVALLSKTDNSKGSESYGFASLSLSQLEDLTGMSRPLAVRATRLLAEQGLISVTSGKGKSNVYEIAHYSAVPWVKLPKRRFHGFPPLGTTLRKLGMRGRATLNGLKLYLYLVASVDKATRRAIRSYDNIEAATGIRRAHIRDAISMLINYQLITVAHEKRSDDANPYNSPNEYTICQ